ncbi:MAG: TIGR03960 family B12-binding radical SAM protein [Brevinematia bacterium]
MKDLKDILPFVEKPSRYTGGEWNSIVKDPSGKTRITLIYPDSYEIGISNLGLKILYNVLNQRKDIYCERAYAPWLDLENSLRENGITLFSLETKTPLNKFDILGFSFQYELTFTNFLNILRLSNIPLYSEERNEIDIPFILAGGPVVTNPEPIAPFVDVFVIGDGETRILEVVDAIKNGKKAKKSRKEILKDIYEIEGCYVPIFYDVDEINGYFIASGKKVKRYIESDIEKCLLPVKQIVPNIQAIQDRAVVEVSRGCVKGCRFCQAGMIYRPVRERNVSTIIDYSKKIIENTGYRELALLSLSISDYSGLRDLILKLEKEFSPHGISISLPSLRLDSFILDLARKAREIRKTGLTFAVEGGSQTIRDYINKGVNEEELFNSISIAHELGWKSVKLYFMIGFMDKPEEEVVYISELAKRLTTTFKALRFTISVAVFIPKPHTPFQWKAQLSPDEAKKAFNLLIGLLKGYKNVNIRYNDPYVSCLEGIFSRGDRRLAKPLEKSYRNGCRFDGWSEFLRLDIWQNAFREEGIDTEFYLASKDENTVFPWDIVDCGMRKDFLYKEFLKAEKKETTKDCIDSCSSFCGVCNFKNTKNRKAKVQDTERESKPEKNFLSNISITSEPEFVLRFTFEKSGNAKYLSTIDLENHLSYSLVRANLPVCFTKGFNPHIKIKTISALPVGIESHYEIGEVELSRSLWANSLKYKWNRKLPYGIRIKDCIIFEKGKRKLGELSCHYVLFEMESPTSLTEVEKSYKLSKTFEKNTKTGVKVISLHDYIKWWKLEGNKLRVVFLQKEGEARLQDVIRGLTGLDIRSATCYNPVVLKRFLLVDNKEVELLKV